MENKTNDNLPGEKIKFLLYTSESTVARLFFSSVASISSSLRSSATLCTGNLLILRCHDVEPVPVEMQIPEHFRLVASVEPFNLICKCDTLADKLSPTNT